METMEDLLRAGPSELLIRMEKKLLKYPLLKIVYSDDCLKEIVKRRRSHDNELLKNLVLKSPVTHQILQELEDNLALLESEGALDSFSSKLRRWDSINFRGAVVELYFAALFKRMGYHIQLEPELPNGQKGDFLALKDGLRIYFELKTLVTRRFFVEDMIRSELISRLHDMDEPFDLSIEITEKMKRKQVIKLSKFIRDQVKEIDWDVNIPFSFVYSENGDVLANIEVIKRFEIGETGFVSGFIYSGGIKTDYPDIRSKISDGISHPILNIPVFYLFILFHLTLWSSIFSMQFLVTWQLQWIGNQES